MLVVESAAGEGDGAGLSDGAAWLSLPSSTSAESASATSASFALVAFAFVGDRFVRFTDFVLAGLRFVVLAT